MQTNLNGNVYLDFIEKRKCSLNKLLVILPKYKI